jgi:hypothetical protein
MHVSFFSRSFLTIIESIIGQIQIITPHQRMFLFIFKKSILTHVWKIHTIRTNDDQNIVMTDNNSLHPLLSKFPHSIAYQT